MARKMKNSGFQWIGEVPSNWGITKLKYIILKSDSGVWGKDPEPGKNNKIVLRSTEQTVDGNWRIKNPAMRNLENLNLEELIIKPNDLLITKSSGSHEHIGKTTIADSSFEGKEIYYSNFLQRIRINKDNNAKFIWYILNSPIAREQFVYLQNSTSGLGNINKKHINNIYVPIPDLKEQTNIVNYLDDKINKINKLIQLNKKSIEAQKSYKQSLIIETVTKGLHPDVSMKDSGIVWFGNIPEDWIVTKISRLFEIKAGGDAKPEYYNDEKNDIYKYPVYTNSSDKNEVYAYTSKPIFNENSITVTGRGEIGIAFYRDVKFDAIIRLLVLTPKFDLDMRYFAYFINNVLEFSTGSSAVGQLSTIQISPYPILLPSKKEQKQIADYLDKKTAQIDQLIKDKTKLIEELENYKQSLIYEYVTGKKEV